MCRQGHKSNPCHHAATPQDARADERQRHRERTRLWSPDLGCRINGRFTGARNRTGWRDGSGQIRRGDQVSERRADEGVIVVKPPGVQTPAPVKVINKRRIDELAIGRRKEQSGRESRGLDGRPSCRAAFEEMGPGGAERIDIPDDDDAMSADRARGCGTRHEPDPQKPQQDPQAST